MWTCLRVENKSARKSNVFCGWLLLLCCLIPTDEHDAYGAPFRLLWSLTNDSASYKKLYFNNSNMCRGRNLSTELLKFMTKAGWWWIKKKTNKKKTTNAALCFSRSMPMYMPQHSSCSVSTCKGDLFFSAFFKGRWNVSRFGLHPY